MATSKALKITLPAKIGAAFFVLWSILHLWVPAEGARVVTESGINGVMHFLTGGASVPHGSYAVSKDVNHNAAIMALFKNFVTDVGGYGLMGLFVAAGILYSSEPWAWLALGTVCIGVADLAFLFFMVLSGTIELNAGTVAGPIIWFLAVGITPFGLPGRGHAAAKTA